MKTEKQMKMMYDFIGFFNDGSFMNQDYRRGLIDAFQFYLYDKSSLERIFYKLKKLYNEEGGGR
jgi:hypothetical protein